MQLRDYQHQLTEEVEFAWKTGHRNVLMTSPTGSGKTHTKSNIVKRFDDWTMCVAHRQELVVQISESLAKYGIYHTIIAPNAVVRLCGERHVLLTGQSYLDVQANVMVGSVQTLVRRADKYERQFNKVRLWDIDEAHHCLPDNQWGKAIQLFPKATGLGVTATPLRLDGKPLRGVFSEMILGPTMRDLIKQNHLTDYRIFCPATSINREAIERSQTTGEFKKDSLLKASKESRIVGDVVQSYLKFAYGKRGITFAVSVETCEDIAANFNAHGIPAAAVSAQTPDRERTELLDKLKTGEILQLVNVDLFGEGMDAPALECISMARPTQSYGLFVQQFGRVLRPADGKTHGMVIDHVGNVVEHGLPDQPRQWSLDGRKKRERGEEAGLLKLRVCTGCLMPYEAYKTACPHCGEQWIPASRAGPREVDGDLEELDPQFLAAMRGQTFNIDSQPKVPYGSDGPVQKRLENIHKEVTAKQIELRQTVSVWAGLMKHGQGMTDREINKLFYLNWRMTILDAMSLRAGDASKLNNVIRRHLT